MTSCLAMMQPPLVDRAQLKRVRSASLAAMTEPPKSALKACKISDNSSPQSPREGVPAETKSTASRPVESVPWPTVSGCQGLSNTLVFLQTSRQHAMVLMMQNHWDRAMTVLEKVENASETVYSHRRRLVIEQANTALNKATPCTPRRPRAVRFHDDVQVADAQEMDRTASEIQSPVREEMLVLRASRAIPRENYSEFWA